MRMRKRGRDLSGPMQDWIVEKALDRWTPKQIFNYLDKLRGDERDKFLQEHQTDDLPPYQTIRRVVSDMTIRDTSDTWRIDDKDTKPEDLRCILDVLRTVIEDSYGEKTTLTKEEVGWILRIAKAAPTAKRWMVRRLVQLYMLYDSTGQSTTDLDTFIAFKPWEEWENGTEFTFYEEFMMMGMIPQLKLISWLQGSSSSETKAKELIESGLNLDGMSKLSGVPPKILAKLVQNRPKLKEFLERDKEDGFGVIIDVTRSRNTEEGK